MRIEILHGLYTYSKHEYFLRGEQLTNATYPDYEGQPRAIYHAMVKFADDVIGNLTAALKAKRMWEDTLLIMTRCMLVGGLNQAWP